MIDREPSKRHWIQVEMNPEIGHGAWQYDLCLVDKYTFSRSAGGVEEVVFTYAGTLAPIGLKGKSAQFFHAEWSKYCQLHAVQPENAPSLIKVAGTKLK